MSKTAEIIFQVEPCTETGGYVARWNAPHGGGITTQGDSFAELDAMIADTVGGYFEPEQRPRSVRLHLAIGRYDNPSLRSHCSGVSQRSGDGSSILRANPAA
jgi:predicted RNase H-like HicB family nuclease